jgi:hypothetical protein
MEPQWTQAGSFISGQRRLAIDIGREELKDNGRKGSCTIYCSLHSILHNHFDVIRAELSGPLQVSKRIALLSQRKAKRWAISAHTSL